MDLFSQLAEDREDKALDRLAGMIALFESRDAVEQTEAMDRALAYCDLEWGSYAAGLDALAARTERRGGGSEDSAWEALRLREEGEHPGAIIRALRRKRDNPLPTSLAQARDDRQRLMERGVGPEELPRLEALEGLLTSGLIATNAEEFGIRIAFLAETGGEGVQALARDWPGLLATLAVRAAGESTKDKARRLKTENPDWSLARIGKQLGISRQATHKHLKGWTPGAP